MYGAIAGDMIGSAYEFQRAPQKDEFPLFSSVSRYTDDSVMTIAVAEALMDTIGADDETVKAALVNSMKRWGRKYPYAGYGGKFSQWLASDDASPYGSYGNGSAMRVSAAGWLFDTMEETRHKARLSADVTHNHPEGIKGAEATASVIYLARLGRSREEIRAYVIREFGYDLSLTSERIRRSNRWVVDCQHTVPESITALMEGTDFEDVVRLAVSLGGDSDTLGAIAGSMAEAFCGIPEFIKDECRNRLRPDQLEVCARFEAFMNEKRAGHTGFFNRVHNLFGKLSRRKPEHDQ